IIKVATQGRRDMDQWFTTYELSLSLNGQHWMSYPDEHGVTKVFTGNSDRSTVVNNSLTSYPYARLVRIIYKTWKNHASLRAELYGCLL
ncbi:predicted protein, partial [Nematostella vectensis]